MEWTNVHIIFISKLLSLQNYTWCQWTVILLAAAVKYTECTYCICIILMRQFVEMDFCVSPPCDVKRAPHRRRIEKNRVRMVPSSELAPPSPPIRQPGWASNCYRVRTARGEVGGHCSCVSWWRETVWEPCSSSSVFGSDVWLNPSGIM
jgi:hypothetical protein